MWRCKYTCRQSRKKTERERTGDGKGEQLNVFSMREIRLKRYGEIESSLFKTRYRQSIKSKL